ncbi:chalcone isomerase family protein [Desulfopila sp. IMCC35008]|uniref:chalcone isomerase family protein n=1 Tax=Desulfopila sp. IMCC35008 TaxID=2653858 RepID=UPI0013D8C08D|nr:chalcone isomerase family protein [Desulfopila sp. IMCC35008]
MSRLVVSFMLVFVLCSTAWSRQIAGVEVAESVEGQEGVELKLNGAGIRSKLFFKIYIAQLYLQNPSSDALAIIGDDGQKRMVMHFLYEEVGADKLIGAWNEGFEGNLDDARRSELAPQIKEFNSMFETVKKGDEVVLDYLPGKGTTVTIKGNGKGTIAGKPFADALFAIWLGEKPVTSGLKADLLGGS